MSQPTRKRVRGQTGLKSSALAENFQTPAPSNRIGTTPYPPSTASSTLSAVAEEDIAMFLQFKQFIELQKVGASTAHNKRNRSSSPEIYPGAKKIKVEPPSPKRNPADELQLMKRTVDMPTQAEILIESPNEVVNEVYDWSPTPQVSADSDGDQHPMKIFKPQGVHPSDAESAAEESNDEIAGADSPTPAPKQGGKSAGKQRSLKVSAQVEEMDGMQSSEPAKDISEPKRTIKIPPRLKSPTNIERRNALVTSSSRSGMKRNAETAANAQEGNKLAGDPTTVTVRNADKGDSDIDEDMVIDVDEPMDDGDNTSKDYALLPTEFDGQSKRLAPYSRLPALRRTIESAYPNRETVVVSCDLWLDRPVKNTNITALLEVIKCTAGSGVINPARCSPEGFKFRKTPYFGITGDHGAPQRFITFGAVAGSHLIAPDRTQTSNPKLVKNIGLEPLIGEWDRSIGFFGTIIAQDLIGTRAFQGAIQFGTTFDPIEDASTTGYKRRGQKSSFRNAKDRVLTTRDVVPVWDAREYLRKKNIPKNSPGRLSLSNYGTLLPKWPDEVPQDCLVGAIYTIEFLDNRNEAARYRAVFNIMEVIILCDPINVH